MSTAVTMRAVTAPGRPGPGPLPEAVLRALDFTIARRIGGLLAGDYRSEGYGAGVELAQIRPYEPGDDVRLIDWNVTARMRQPHVKVHVAERVLTTWLVLDLSPSMAFGTADRRKMDVAEGVALAAGHIATRRGNRLGVVTFGDATSRVFPPGGGRAGMLGLLLALRDEPRLEGQGATSIGEALCRVAAIAGQSKLVIVASDFRGPRDWPSPLLELAGRNTVLAVEIRDPREQELPEMGELHLVDPETGRHLSVDTGRPGIRERFAAAAAAERAEVASQIRLTGAQHVVLSTRGDWLRPFAAAVRAKGAR